MDQSVMTFFGLTVNAAMRREFRREFRARAASAAQGVTVNAAMRREFQLADGEFQAASGEQGQNAHDAPDAPDTHADSINAKETRQHRSGSAGGADRPLYWPLLWADRLVDPADVPALNEDLKEQP